MHKLRACMRVHAHTHTICKCITDYKVHKYIYTQLLCISKCVFKIYYLCEFTKTSNKFYIYYSHWYLDLQIQRRETKPPHIWTKMRLGISKTSVLLLLPYVCYCVLLLLVPNTQAYPISSADAVSIVLFHVCSVEIHSLTNHYYPGRTYSTFVFRPVKICSTKIVYVVHYVRGHCWLSA